VNVDACIIGGGPAGAVFATRLAQLGHAVTLIERAAFPRAHLGESLSPGVLPLLGAIGARRAIEDAGFPRVAHVEIDWENGPEEKQDPAARGLLVDRGEFDRRLLAHAAACGVRVLQPARVVRVQRQDDAWQLDVTRDGKSATLTARFVADASGRAGVLPRRRRFTGPRTVALHAYWRGCDLPPVPRIAAGDDGWYWRVPLPDGTSNTLFFTAPENATAARNDFDARLIRAGILPRDANTQRLTAVRIVDATPHLDELCVSSSSIKLGDAALALDPLSSSGVQKAIQSALSAAIVANTLLRVPERAALAQQFYRDSLAASSARHAAWAAERYAAAARIRPHRFWIDRGPEVARASRPWTAPRAANMGQTPMPPHGQDARATKAAPDPLRADTPLAVAAELEFAEVACAGELFIETQLAIRHRALDGPVAYLGGHALAPLLRRVARGATTREIAQRWAPRVPEAVAEKIIAWLWQRELLRPAEAPVSAP
jgi:flavin-dependent dehydrogenase